MVSNGNSNLQYAMTGYVQLIVLQICNAYVHYANIYLFNTLDQRKQPVYILNITLCGQADIPWNMLPW